MRKRILKLLGLLIAIAVVGFLLLIWTAPASRVNKTTFGKITRHMSAEDVEQLLGKPGELNWRDWAEWSSVKSLKTEVVSYSEDKDGWRFGGEMRYWSENGHLISVEFDQNRRVAFVSYARKRESYIDTMRRWLRLGGSP